MELMLNELSCLPLSPSKASAFEKMRLFAHCVSEARKHGYKNVRSDSYENEILLLDDYSLKDWLLDKSAPPDLKNFIYGVIIRPYINDEDDEFNKFVTNDYVYQGTKEFKCIGLAAAYLYETLTISFQSSETWKQNFLIVNERKDDILTAYKVLNVFSNDCFKVKSIADFIENSKNLELIECPLNQTEKKVTLFGDHHGKKELEKLSNMLIRSKYVIEVRSTGFGGSSFIRKIYKDGVLEIVDINSDRRYTLWVQTTGRNYRETEAISEILTAMFS